MRKPLAVDGVTFTARFSGTPCDSCEEPIREGQEVEYNAADKIVHAVCPETLDVDDADRPAVRDAHQYDTTRTSPFGYYVSCSCGWTSGQYRATGKDAWLDWTDHQADMIQRRPAFAEEEE